jgi:DNA-binding transcriptional LysR family regulator
MPEAYDGLMEVCFKYGFSPRVLVHVPEPTQALLLAATGLGLAPVPEAMERVNIEGLRFLPFADAVLGTRLALVTRADEQAQAVKILRHHALAAARVEETP